MSEFIRFCIGDKVFLLFQKKLYGVPAELMRRGGKSTGVSKLSKSRTKTALAMQSAEMQEVSWMRMPKGFETFQNVLRTSEKFGCNREKRSYPL
mmetsp:Transcript_2996/g.4696  ORF Transcript_2996/g.4696 Transcript_2996/m.4696 type:complete len:94 (-) Transcript_2996:141-422(-)